MIRDKIAEGHKRVWMIRGIGSRKIGLNPLTFSKAYWACVISKVAYGLELCNCRRDSVTLMNNFHFDVAKKVQGLPTSTSNIVPLSAISWERLATEIMRRCLLFHWQIMNLPTSSIYKQTMSNRLVDILRKPECNKTGPTVQFVENLKSLGLVTQLKDNLVSGEICSKGIWKKEVTKRLQLLEGNEWRASVLMASGLSEFKEVVHSYHCGFPWWKIAKWNNKMLGKAKKLLKYMTMNITECTKVTCGCSEKVSLTHILFVCNKISQQRRIDWCHVKAKMPEQMVLDIEGMLPEQRSVYLLSCMNGNPLREWQSIYERILIYCNNMINAWNQVNTET